jgi:hypothetical protein
MLLHTAIQALRPSKEFTMYGDDPSTIVWNDEDVITPTDKEIKDKYAELLAAEQKAEADKVAQRSAILEKLGLSEEEIKVLLA